MFNVRNNFGTNLSFTMRVRCQQDVTQDYASQFTVIFSLGIFETGCIIQVIAIFGIGEKAVLVLVQLFRLSTNCILAGNDE